VTGRPLAVAHRAGNDLGALRAAEALGVDMVEADLHLFGGRIEVRHLKTVGPLPILWDRWWVASPFTPRMTLQQLIAAAAPATQLLLDLKGPRVALARATRDIVVAECAGRRVTVCARNWRLLRPFRDAPGVRIAHTVATAGRLRAFPRVARDAQVVSIDHRLLTPAALPGIPQLAPLVLAWGVDDLERMRELHDAGVGGFITSQMHVLRAILGLA
jgi:glycerophosphoryl diester phosphodiesterase